MTKTTEALRIELEDLKNKFYELSEEQERESIRTDRIVQVLLNNLPEENLNKIVRFAGQDCHDEIRWWTYWDGHTLREFLNEIIDP